MPMDSLKESVGNSSKFGYSASSRSALRNHLLKDLETPSAPKGLAGIGSLDFFIKGRPSFAPPHRAVLNRCPADQP